MKEVLASLFIALLSFGVLPPAAHAIMNPSLAAVPSADVHWTFYAPGAGGSMQGSMFASRADAGGKSNLIHTLDDVRKGFPYVTLASSDQMYGKWFCIGTVTYTSPDTTIPKDQRQFTLTNVIGYTHDTGCAFNHTCKSLAGYTDGVRQNAKFDIAVGNFTGYGAIAASNYVSKNRNVAPKQWQSITGLPDSTKPVSASQPCGSQSKTTGAPVPAAYVPESLKDDSLLTDLKLTTAQSEVINNTDQSSLATALQTLKTAPATQTAVEPPQSVVYTTATSSIVSQADQASIIASMFAASESSSASLNSSTADQVLARLANSAVTPQFANYPSVTSASQTGLTTTNAVVTTQPTTPATSYSSLTPASTGVTSNQTSPSTPTYTPTAQTSFTSSVKTLIPGASGGSGTNMLYVVPTEQGTPATNVTTVINWSNINLAKGA